MTLPEWTTRWPGDDGPFRVRIVLGEVTVRGVPRVDALAVTLESLGRQPVSASVWRTLPVWSLVARAVRERVAERADLMRGPAISGGTVTFALDDEGCLRGTLTADDQLASVREEHWSRVASDLAGALPRRGRRREITSDFLEQVANVYRSSKQEEARQAVAGHFQATPAAASKWIARARKAGLLERLVTAPTETHREDS